MAGRPRRRRREMEAAGAVAGAVSPREGGARRELVTVTARDDRAVWEREREALAELGAAERAEAAGLLTEGGGVMSAEARTQAEVSCAATLEGIRRTQRSTRDERGRLRRARVVAAVLAMRAEGFTPVRTAELLGLSVQQVTGALTTLRRDATIAAQVERLTALAVPLAVDNAIRGVMEGDKEYTLRVLDGTGLFKMHQAVKGEITHRVTSLSVVVSQPTHLAGRAMSEVLPGQVVGAPQLTEGSGEE